jgi:hypothetical protein
MAIDEALEATYKVRYFVDPPLIPHQDDKLPKMDYTQAINVATLWVKDGRDIEIRDGSRPIILVVQKGAEFITFDPNHTHFEEHLKIKIALDKVWGDLMSKYLQ